MINGAQTTLVIYQKETFHAPLFLLTFLTFFFINAFFFLKYGKLKVRHRDVCLTLFTSTTVIYAQSQVRPNIPECRVCGFTAFTFSLKHLIMTTTDTTKTSSNQIPAY